MKIAELTYPEVKLALDQGAVALWPTGATEAHGPHLPLNTDVVIAGETCARAVDRIKDAHGLQALILPPLAYSVTHFAAPFSGTVDVPRQTVLAYVRDVILGVAAQGFRAVVLVNAHLEPAHRFTLRDAVEEARKATSCAVGLADPADKRWVDRLTEEFKSGSCHAGQYETSLMMAAAPGSVREDLRQNLEPLEIDLVDQIKAGADSFADAGAPQAYCGRPRAATVEEGNDSYERLADIVVEVTGEILRGDAP